MRYRSLALSLIGSRIPARELLSPGWRKLKHINPRRLLKGPTNHPPKFIRLNKRKDIREPPVLALPVLR